MPILANLWPISNNNNMANDPAITTMNVSLPKPLKRYVDEKVSSGVYGSASEFVREAIREKYQREQDRREAQQALTDKLLTGLDSGQPVPITSGHFRRKKAALAKENRR
jgi:antitoxin ParD1/3/4